MRDDPIQRLRDTWVAWDQAAANTPKWPTAHWLHHEAHDLADAIAALGIDGGRLHDLVAKHRQRAVAGHPEGLSLLDAIESALIELLPTERLEAS